MQRRRYNVIRPFVRQLDDVLAQVGLYRFEAVVFQALVEIDLVGGHRFRFDNKVRLALRGEVQDKIGNFRAIFAIHYVPAVCLHVPLEFFQVMIQVIDGVLLDGIGLRAQFLVIGQRRGGDAGSAMVLEPARRGVDGQLKIGIGQGCMRLLIELEGHRGISGLRALRPGAWRRCSIRLSKGRLESA